MTHNNMDINTIIYSSAITPLIKHCFNFITQGCPRNSLASCFAFLFHFFDTMNSSDYVKIHAIGYHQKLPSYCGLVLRLREDYLPSSFFKSYLPTSSLKKEFPLGLWPSTNDTFPINAKGKLLFLDCSLI